MSAYSSHLENDVLRASPTHSTGLESTSFRTPERSRRVGGGSPHSASESTDQRSQAQQSSSNAQSHAELQSLMQRWNNLSASMRGHAQSAAEVLMQQAGATAQAEDLVQHLLHQLQLREEEKRRLEAQVLQDRADFTSQAKLLSQHFTLSHHRNTALQVAHEALQGELRASREQAERGAHESHALRQQLAVVQKELMRENEARLQADSALQEHGAAIEEMQHELQHSRSCCEELHAAKAQLQAQVKSMVRAETELTDNLKHTHQQIDDQLNLLREQLQQERQKRMQATRRKAELAQQVSQLTDQLDACKEALEQQQQQLEGSPDAGQQLRQALNAAKGLAPSVRSTLMRRTKAVKMTLPTAARGGQHDPASARLSISPQQQQQSQQQQHAVAVGYTAAFAPSSAAAARPASSSSVVSGGSRLTPDSSARSQHRPSNGGQSVSPPPPPQLPPHGHGGDGASPPAATITVPTTSVPQAAGVGEAHAPSPGSTTAKD